MDCLLGFGLLDLCVQPLGFKVYPDAHKTRVQWVGSNCPQFFGAICRGPAHCDRKIGGLRQSAPTRRGLRWSSRCVAASTGVPPTRPAREHTAGQTASKRHLPPMPPRQTAGGPHFRSHQGQDRQNGYRKPDNWEHCKLHDDPSPGCV